MVMERIYGYGMTTTSGGNLSIKDEQGDLWITPRGVDKGSLEPRDIVRVKPDGSVEGIHNPSMELPFHKAIYKQRPEVRAILHSHPPALVSFSISRKIPDTSILPNARVICGEVGLALYALPGSIQLGENIASKFAEGHDTVILENHGIATTGNTLFEAFERFETLDYCARLIIKANSLGTACSLSEEELSLIKGKSHLVPEFLPPYHTSEELEARKEICRMIHRAYNQRICMSTQGTFSVRLRQDEFLITPYAVDRKYIQPEDLVLIQDGKREKGKIPSRSLLLHQQIYRLHPDIGAVLIAHPPNAMAFGVSHTRFDTLTIPESYLLLRDIPLLPYGSQYREREKVAEMLTEKSPVVLIENDCLITTGGSLRQAFDRLEVAEFSAKALIYSQNIGKPVYISEKQKEELTKAFGG